MLNGGYSYRERLPRAASERLIVAYLAERYRHSSERAWRERVEQGQVLVDGVAVGASRKLAQGETLVWHRPPWREPKAPTGFAILYRDEDLIAVAKPSGLPTMPGASFLERTLLYRVRSVDASAAPLHRLGRGTSGIVLFTRNSAARRSMTAAWQAGQVERHYRALVQGNFPTGEQVIEEPIGLVSHSILDSIAARNPGGKPARTHARLLEARGASSLVAVRIETGRSHQIRIHLAAKGHPLVGDSLYPSGGIPKEGETTLPGELGYWLHALNLRFPHPRDGRKISIDCESPRPLRLSAKKAIRRVNTDER